jgi:hypothetical protein
MHARMSLEMFSFAFRLQNTGIPIVRVSSKSDCSGAAFDHDVAAGAAISTVCSSCQAGTYSSGAGWVPLLQRRRARTTNQALMSACRFSEARTGWGWRKSCSKCDSGLWGHTWTRACLHALLCLDVSMARERVRACGCKDRPCKVGTNEIIFLHHQISLFRHRRFPIVFVSMKITESKKNILGSCIVDFDDVQV